MSGSTILHAHSRDAAQQGFSKACKTAKACRAIGLDNKYPHKRKKWRTTIWKNTGIVKDDRRLILKLARGHPPILVLLPETMQKIPPEAFLEARLVWDRVARHYFWHLVIEDGESPKQSSGANVAGVDLGEIHPATVSDGEESVVFSARQLRSLAQYGNKRLAELQAKQASKVKGSRRWWRIQRRKNRFLAQQKRRKRDIEHKVRSAVIKWAERQGVSTLTVGDVRDCADEVYLGKKANQKISN